MISKEFFKNIEAVAEEKELTHDQVVEAFVQGMIAGCKKAHDVRSCRVDIREEKFEILVYKQQLVVDEYSIEADKNYTQILLPDAKQINSRMKVGDILEQKIDPKDFGISRSPISDLRGGDSSHNASITMAIFEGEAGAPRDAVLLNAAAAIAAYEGRSDINVQQRIELGLQRATEAVDSGAAKNLVKQWALLSNQLA